MSKKDGISKSIDKNMHAYYIVVWRKNGEVIKKVMFNNSKDAKKAKF